MTMKSDTKITKGLTASKRFEVRFSEVDSMNIVWHGSYPLYFEDAREAFGARYGLGYMDIFGNGYYAPLVELSFKYKSPIVYGMPCRIDIHYAETDELLATGHSVQVFMDKEYRLVWITPEFYAQWKERWNMN